MNYLRTFKPKAKVLPTLTNLFADGENLTDSDANSRLSSLREILILSSSSSSANQSTFLDNLSLTSNNIHLILVKWHRAPQFAQILYSIPWRSLVFKDPDGITIISILFDMLSDMIAVSPTYIQALIRNIVLKIFLGDTGETENIKIGSMETKIFQRVHLFLKDLVDTYPPASRQITNLLGSSFPHYMTATPHSYTAYVTNLMAAIDYLPNINSIFSVLIDKLIWLELTSYSMVESNANDATSPTNESNADGKTGQDLELSLKCFKLFDHVFDLLLAKIYELLHPESMTYDFERAEVTIQSLEDIFFNQVLNVEALINLPFTLLYWSSLSTDLRDRALNKLWDSSISSYDKANPRTVLILASMMVESCNITTDQVVTFLENAVNWSLVYANSRSEITIDENFNPNVHSNFYAVTQSIFYLISCKIADFNSIQLKSLRLLNMQSLIGTKLNPLLYCLPTIVEQFVEVTREYQIALCSVVVDRNKRLGLDSSAFFSHPLCYYFPFNSYTFQSASSKFDSILSY